MSPACTKPRGRIEPPTLVAIRDAIACLQAGDIIGLPTETVYGLGADASNREAVMKIFAAKGRPADHPLIVHLPSAEHLTRWAENIPDAAVALARAFWPGPLTLILKRKAGVLDAVTGGQDTVGLRVPSHSIALAILQGFNGGIAAPSANRFGRISPTQAEHVRDELGSAVSLTIDGGPCQMGIESTILDLSGDEVQILRPGSITAEQIAAVIGHRPRVRGPVETQTEPAPQAAPRVSGSLAAHYAPATRLRLMAADELGGEATRLADGGVRCAVLSHSRRNPGDERLVWVDAAADAINYAHDLYAHLRRLDAMGLACILVEKPPTNSSWSAVADRLNRAAVGSGTPEGT